MKDLIERLEKATGPSRELDADILWLVDKRRAEKVYWSAVVGLPKALPDWPRPLSGLGSLAVLNYSPSYTASIDAALTLVPEGMFVRKFSQFSDGWYCTIINGSASYAGDQKPAALALCIAALKALSSTGKADE